MVVVGTLAVGVVECGALRGPGDYQRGAET